MKLILLDVAMASGAALMAYGMWRAWAPGGFMLGGLLLAGGAFLIGNGIRTNK